MNLFNYRGFRLAQYESLNGSWIIYNLVGQQVVAGSFQEKWMAQQHIDMLHDAVDPIRAIGERVQYASSTTVRITPKKREGE